MGLESGLQDKPSAAAGEEKKNNNNKQKNGNAHSCRGDELTSKLQTHCRYRHLGPASSLTGCVGGSGGTGGVPKPLVVPRVRAQG